MKDSVVSAVKLMVERAQRLSVVNGQPMALCFQWA